MVGRAADCKAQLVSERRLLRSTKNWTTALLATGLVVLLAIVAATFWLGERAQKYATDVTQIRELRVSAVELRNALLTAESSQRGFLYSDNEIYLAPFDSANAAARRETIELVEDAKRFPQLQPLIGRLSALVEAKIQEMEETASLIRQGSPQQTMDHFLSNRGKTLMDQINLFVNGLIGSTDKLLIDGVSEQVANANWLTWTSIAGGLAIMLLVAGAVTSFMRTTREIASARDQTRAANETLERRVDERTSALKAALTRSEVLLSEVNHRVANSLAMVGSLVRLQVRSSKDAAVKEALNETVGRISAIAAVHKRLYQSGDVGLVALDEYLTGVLEGLATTMRAAGSGGLLTWKLDHAQLDTDASINVGVVVTELVTNAYKYAYPEGDGEIRVLLHRKNSSNIEIVVEDDGVGRGTGAAQGTGLGSRIVTSMSASLGTEVRYFDRNPGTSARISLPARAA